jgi:hypothetical protein
MRLQKWVVGVSAAGIAIVGVALAQPPKSAPNQGVKQVAGTTVVVAEPAKPTDLGTMLAEARGAHSKLRDYTGTFTRQERIRGTLGAEQVGEMKARISPAGMYVRFARPEGIAGMEVAYTGRKPGKVQYRPAGIAGRKGFQKLELDDAKFLADNRHPVTEWGIGPIIDTVSTAVAREKTLNNPVEVYTGDYQFANRNVIKYEILSRRPHAFRYAAKMVLFIDTETRLPVRFEAYDEPKSGATTGELLEAYSFTDLKFNNGLGENSFDY